MLTAVWKAVFCSLNLKFLKAGILRERRKALQRFLDAGDQVVLPLAMHPECTIVIPTYNGAEHTLHCLLSLLPQCAEWLEILVYDDCSTDETAKLLSKFENLSIIRSAENLGFLKAVNAGVRKARGEFVIIMNNDACLIEGSIRQAIAQFQVEPSCGYMGFRLLLADGSLQEAGCMIFQNGKTNGHLRFAMRDDLSALFLREVDYCSAVFCLFRRDQFLRMGGFDLAYSPAYFEETDFCMRLRAEGLRCIYNPALLVGHFEFGSQKSFTARKAISDRRKIFLSRWRDTMRSESYSKSLFGSKQDMAALRLQPSPRQLLVMTAPIVEGPIVESLAAFVGSTTLHVIGATDEQLELLIGRFGPRVEISASGRPSGVSKLLSRRPHYFNVVKML